MSQFSRNHGSLRAIVCAGIAALALAVTALASSDANAQAFPSKRVSIIVPYAPGGIVDLFGRMLAPHLGERFGQTVVVENRPSLSGNVGAIYGARSAPDGYTVTLVVTTNLIASMIAAESPYDMEKDFAPVTQMAEYYSILVTKPSLPVKNTAELIALIKAKPGAISNGTSGIGSSAHIGMALLAEATGTNALHVPYKGEGPVLTALLTGEIDMAFITYGGADPLVRAGKVRAIGVTSLKRGKQFPDVPAIAETVPGFEYAAWIGALVPSGTPRDRIDFLFTGISSALQKADVQKNLASRSIELIGSTPDQFGQRLRADADRFRKLIKKLGLKAE